DETILEFENNRPHAAEFASSDSDGVHHIHEHRVSIFGDMLDVECKRADTLAAGFIFSEQPFDRVTATSLFLADADIAHVLVKHAHQFGSILFSNAGKTIEFLS